MNQLDDDKIKASIREAHLVDEQAAPAFDAIWDAAESNSLDPDRPAKDLAIAVGISGGVLAAAAGIAVIGFVGVILMYAMTHNPPAHGPIVHSQADVTTPNQDSTADPFDGYDIVDWRPETDSLLAQDNRMMHLPELGDPTWGADDWEDLDSLDIEEL